MDRSASFPIDRTVAVPVEFVRSVYAWMFVGLALTSVAALYTAGSPALLKAIFGNKLVFYALIFGELGLVIAISGAINRLSAAAATGLFLLYSALNGVTFASIFLVYTGGSIASDLLCLGDDVRSDERVRLRHQARPDRLGELSVHGADRGGDRRRW